MRRMTTVVVMFARCRVDYLHVLTKDLAMTGAQLYQYGSCLPFFVFLASACSAVAMVGGRPLSSFDELLSMAVLTISWWMLLIADL